jgi:hypothetical protein
MRLRRSREPADDGSGDVQCQRTRGYLAESADGQTWICPWCPDHEVYRRASSEEHAARYADAAIAMCCEEFRARDDGIATVVWLGEYPETVYKPDLEAWHIYLDRDSDRWQLLYSGAHEAFHRVCSPQNVPSWTHEMLAVHFSLRF